ncbi:MAG TPA: hypothetical protein VII35_07785, partial [Steroidobacteraceae bacterium]
DTGIARRAQGMRRASALVAQLLRLARLDEPAPFAPETIDAAQLFSTVSAIMSRSPTAKAST